MKDERVATEIFSQLYQTIASSSNKEAIKDVLARNHITPEEAIKYLKDQYAADEYFKIRGGEKLVSPILYRQCKLT